MILGLEEAAQKLRDAGIACEAAKAAVEKTQLASELAVEAERIATRAYNQAACELREVASGKTQGLL